MDTTIIGEGSQAKNKATVNPGERDLQKFHKNDKVEQNRSWMRTRCTICSNVFASYFKKTKLKLLNSYR